ncbi:MAG TPA: serine/threonine protein kinase, partial [Planctomycetes bacterium]|nr:serine/threonine protein kinase [Planctomycetota bacterium]
MNRTVIAVDQNPHNAESLHPTRAGDSPPVASPGRFTYPSGSRPLEGYTIKRGVGHGGFGEVYYAHSDGGKEVALKLIRRNLEVELRGVRQCLNVKHPHLLAIYDIREDEDGDTWVVMEYVSGQPLEEVIAAHPEGMPTDEVLRWIHGIGAGVAYLHDHGIVHRDLKPGNVFCEEGVVKVGDYGLSKFISCSRRSGHTESVGTVHYMAPEVANGRYGKEIDIYALGVILYEMLTGRVPFEGESVGEVLMKHLTATPDVSMLEEPYRSVVARALEKDPAKRFAGVEEMLAQLPRPSQEPIPGPRRVGRGRPVGAEQAVADAIPVAEVVAEEPILRAVRRACRRAYDAWNESNLNTPAKIVIIVAGVFAVLALAEGLVPLIFMLFVLYGAYWLVWKFFLSGSASGVGEVPRAGTPRPSAPAATKAAEVPKAARRA